MPAKALSGAKAVAGKEDNSALRCEPSGPPQILILPNPWEIVQIPGRVLMFFEEQHIWRTIWADGRPLPKDPDPSYLGYSVGRWEGDTFVVETIGFNDKEWVDLYGNPRTPTTHLTERYRRLNHDTLEQQIIIEDPRSVHEAVGQSSEAAQARAGMGTCGVVLRAGRKQGV